MNTQNEEAVSDSSGDTGNAKGADPEFQISEAHRLLEVRGGGHFGGSYLPAMMSRVGIKQGSRVLDIGCGIGHAVLSLMESGYDAYGLEPGGRFNEVSEELSGIRIFNKYLEELNNTQDFRNSFDFVYSLGVIEHVGTTDGHDTLADNYQDIRDSYYGDALDALKPGGWMMVYGPNRHFPFDFQHGPHRYEFTSRLKEIFPKLSKLTVPWHEKNFLVSWNDVHAGVLRAAAARDIKIKALYPSQYGMVGLGSVSSSAVRSAFHAYTKTADTLPKPIAQLMHTHTCYLAQKSEA